MELCSINMKKIVTLIAFAVTIFLIGLHLSKIVSFLFSVFAPLFLGICIALVLNVYMSSMENLWDKFIDKKSKLKLPLCLLSTLLLAFLVIIIVMFVIAPEISKTINTLTELFPSYIGELKENIINCIEMNNLTNSIDISSLEVNLNKFSDSLMSYLSVSGKSFFNLTLNNITSVYYTFINISLGFILALYMLVHKKRLNKQIIKTLNAYLNKTKVNGILKIAKISNDVFSKFVSDKIPGAVLTALICFIGIIVLQLPYATMISTLIGFTSLIPVVGLFLGMAVGALLIMLVNPIQAVWFILFIIVMNQIEKNFIYPNLMSKTMGVPSFWVLAFVMIGGSFSGIIGALISVPLCSIVYILLRDNVKKKLEKKSLNEI